METFQGGAARRVSALQVGETFLQPREELVLGIVLGRDPLEQAIEERSGAILLSAGLHVDRRLADLRPDLELAQQPGLAHAGRPEQERSSRSILPGGGQPLEKPGEDRLPAHEDRREGGQGREASLPRSRQAVAHVFGAGGPGLRVFLQQLLGELTVWFRDRIKLGGGVFEVSPDNLLGPLAVEGRSSLEYFIEDDAE